MNSKMENEHLAEVATLLFEIISGRKDIELSSNVFTQEVVIDVDGYRFYGIETVKAWICFLRSRRRVSNVEVIANHMNIEDDWLVFSGNWRGIRRGRPIVSNECVASYKMAGRYITEIQTRRVNYAFFLGNGIKYRIVFIFILFYFWIWKRLFMRPNSGKD